MYLYGITLQQSLWLILSFPFFHWNLVLVWACCTSCPELEMRCDVSSKIFLKFFLFPLYWIIFDSWLCYQTKPDGSRARRECWTRSGHHHSQERQRSGCWESLQSPRRPPRGPGEWTPPPVQHLRRHAWPLHPQTRPRQITLKLPHWWVRVFW